MQHNGNWVRACNPALVGKALGHVPTPPHRAGRREAIYSDDQDRMHWLAALREQGTSFRYSQTEREKVPNHGLSPTPGSASSSGRSAGDGGRAVRVGLA